jgi:hypothetical protein
MEMGIAQGNMSARRRFFWTRWRLGHTLATGVLALVLVGVFAAPARAHVHVFIGGVFGLPLPAYPYVTTYPYVPAYPYAYVAPGYPRYPLYGGYAVLAPPAVPPRAWARGHWAWRGGPRNRHVRVWVPSHLR